MTEQRRPFGSGDMVKLSGERGPRGGNPHNPGGRGLGEIPRAELEGRVLAAEALLRRWMGGLVPVGDYTLRDETLAVLGEQEATPPEPLDWEKHAQVALEAMADASAPQGEAEPPKGAA